MRTAVLALGLFPLAAIGAAVAALEGTLAWEPFDQHYAAAVGEKEARVQFAVTNTADHPIIVTKIQTSCGCTTVDAPKLPWTLAPGAHATIGAKVDLVDKWGEMKKTVYVTSDVGIQELTVHLTVPLPRTTGDRREQGVAIMHADRQAIFRRDDCISCHAHTAALKTGAPLFQAACAICHAAEHRASMVPDLAATARPARDATYWRHWIAEGRENSLMPAFSQRAGGPLSDAQIDSLVAYLLQTYPPVPAAAPSTPRTPVP